MSLIPDDSKDKKVKHIDPKNHEATQLATEKAITFVAPKRDNQDTSNKDVTTHFSVAEVPPPSRD